MMIERKKYVEPEVKFNRFTLDRSIANVCWGYAARNEPGDYDPLFYDYSGKGYIHFNIGGGNCKGIGTDTFVESIDFHNVPIEEQETAKAEFDQWLKDVAGTSNKGSNYKGDRFSEGEPGNWS